MAITVALTDGRGFDIDLHRFAAGNAVSAVCDGPADLLRWQAGKHDLRPVCDLAWRRRRNRATVGQRAEPLTVGIADHQRKAAIQQTLRHGAAHVAASDEAEQECVPVIDHRSRLFSAQSNFSFNSSIMGAHSFPCSRTIASTSFGLGQT